MNKKNIFALLQWIGGDYASTYTAGIPIDWIFDFDAENFNPDDEDSDITYVIQWRESKNGKIPKGGWKNYDAKVIQISDDIELLNKQIEILEGTVSPLRPKHTCNYELIDIHRKKLGAEYGMNKKSKFQKRKTQPIDNTTPGCSKTFSHCSSVKKSKKRQSDNLEIVDDIQKISVSLPKKKKIKIRKTKPKMLNKIYDDINDDGEIIDSENEDNDSNSDNNNESDRGTNFDFESGEEENLNPNLNINAIYQDNKIIKNALLDICNQLKGVKETQRTILDAQNNRLIPNGNAEEQVEIHPGSNIFITRQQWETANSRESYQKMGVSLVQALFDDEILINSNLRGGLSKIDKNKPRKPALDQNIIAAITETVKTKYPNTFKKCLFGMAINNFITEKRRKNRIAVPNQDDPGEDNE